MTMTCREVLMAARALIADPKHWAKHSFALNKRGKPVSATSHSATCFCALGAVQNVMNSKDRDNDIYQKVRSSLNNASQHLGRGSIVDVNDFGTHELVLTAFDLAIEKEKEA